MMDFEEFLREGLVRMQGKDAARAKNLIAETKNRKRFLESISKMKDNATYIVENVYDIIRELIEAKMSMDGYKSYSHEATVAYLTRLGFHESEVVFIDELRKIRNRIKYYGKSIDFDYALSVLQFLGKIHEKLMRLVK